MNSYGMRIEINTGNTEQRLQALRRELAKVELGGSKMTDSLNGVAIGRSIQALTDVIAKMGRGSSSASSDVEKLQKQLLQAQVKSEQLAASLNKSNSQLAKLGQAFEKSKATGAKFANELQKANAKIDDMAKKMRKTEQEARHAFGGIGDKLKSLVGISLFGMGISDVLRTADAMKTLDTQIKLVTKSEQEHAAVKANLYNIANKTQQNITSTIEAYTNNARSLGQLGKNQAEVLKFTENISLAMAVGGKSATEQSAALLQLGQAMQSGVLQGDEFRSIAENSPILLDLIAEKLGKTRGEVKKLASDGKITSEVIYQSVIGAGDELNKKFATMPVTMSQALTTVQNRYTQFVDDFFNQSGGLSEQIAKSLLWVSDNFGTLTNTVMGLGVVYGGYMALNSTFVATTIPAKIAALTASTSAFYAESVAINANTAAKIRNDGVIKTLTTSLQATRVGQFTSSLAGVTAELGKGTARMVSYTNEARKTHGALGALRLGAVNATTAIFNKNRAIGALNATKGVLIGTAGRLGAIMTTLGRAVLGVGSIIKAHPIIFLASIIVTVITATMGLEEAIKSFGDAVGITGILVQDFVKWSVDGIGTQMTKAIDFMAGFFGSKSKDGTNQASNAFKDFFKTSEGGFVGLLEISAKIFDKIITIAKASFMYASSYINDMTISAKNAYNAMMPSWMGGGGEQQATRNMSFSEAFAQSESFWAQNSLGNAKTKYQAKQAANDKALQNSLGQVGAGAASAANGLNKLGKEADKAKLKGEDEKYTYTKEELKALQKVHGLIYGSELKKYAEQQGVPVHMLAGLMMQESKGERYAKSHTGALGYFQTTSGYRKDMGLSEKDSYDLIKSGRAAIDFLRQSYKDFGNWDDAIRSYNAGRGGARTFNKTGKVSGNAARNKEVAEYVPKIARYAAYFNNGKSELGKNSNAAQQSYEFTEKQLKTQEELLKAQQELILKYSDHATRQLATLEAEKKAVNDAFGESSEEGRKLNAIIETRYKLADELRQREQLLETQGYQMSIKERMALEHDIHNLKIKMSDEYSEQEKEVYLRASAEKYQHDLAMFKNAQDEKIKELSKPITHAIAEQERITIARMNQKTMRPDDYRRWELSQEIADARRTADDTYSSQFGEIFKRNDGGQYEIESQDERFRLWEEAYRLHKETIANIEAEYDEKSKTLNDELLSAKLQSYSSAAGALAGLFKDMSGEQSSAYRAMFAVSKAFDVAQASKNVYVAASDAFAKEPGTVWQKMAAATAAVVKSSSFIPLISAINPKGFKTGGYTGNGGINDVAGVVHGKEYVLNAKTTKRIGVDNLNRLNNGGSMGSGQTVIVNVTVNSDGTSSVDSQAQMGKQMGEAIKVAVQQEMMKQTRQGGLLYGR